MKHARTNPNARRRDTRTRGNTIVLVAGILVLLVIIATSYLTRTQSQRTIAVATSSAQQSSNAHKVIAEDVAEQIALQLFVWPIDPELFQNLLDDPNLTEQQALLAIMDANIPRLHPTMYSMVHFDLNNNPIQPSRYNVDWSPGGQKFAWHYAPYHTVPYTNWPMPITIDPDDPPFAMWPAGPGNPVENAGMGNGSPLMQGWLASEYNPLGSPGFSDNRILADIEPVRFMLGGNHPQLGGAEAFSHWRKLTNLSHPNNQWRILVDISDVTNSVVHDLNIPVEQFLAIRPRNIVPVANNVANMEFGAGNSSVIFGPGGAELNLATGNPFMSRWKGWFGLPNPMGWEYADLYATPVPNNPVTSAPATFYNLRNLNASTAAAQNATHQAGERPQDEFVPGTWRHYISRVLADTTGDGFTDAFWFVTPVPVRDGVMTIAAVRVIDNSAMLNMNVAGRFQPNDTPSGMTNARRKTRGHFPADLAAVGELEEGSSTQFFSPPAVPVMGTWNVGLLDNQEYWGGNQQFQRKNAVPNTFPWTYWERHLNEIGMASAGALMFPTQDQRRSFWRLSGRMGLDEPTYLENTEPRFRPYSLSDEIKLRMFYGNNHPWIFTRFEAALHHSADGGLNPGILRAGTGNEESTEYMDQLSNTRLVRDLRRQITLYSGARNDLMPPWLWWENRRLAVPGIVADFISEMGLNADEEFLAVRRFINQSRQKLDLRELDELYYFYDPATGQPEDPAAVDVGRLNFRDRLAQMILLALTDDAPQLQWEHPGTMAMQRGNLRRHLRNHSYFGPYTRSDYTQDGTLIRGFTHQSGNNSGPFNNVRRMAAGYTANLLAYTWPADRLAQWSDVVLLPAYQSGDPNLATLPEGRLQAFPPTGDPGDLDSLPKVGFLPIQKQPFLTEALIAHIHVADEVLHPNPDADGYPLPPPGIFNGDRYFCQKSDRRVSMIVVEVANPHDSAIELEGFELAVFGNAVEMWTATGDMLGPNESRVYYLLPDVDWIDADKWRTYAGINDMIEGENRIRVVGITGDDPDELGWRSDRQFYDDLENLGMMGAVEIRQRVWDEELGVDYNVAVDRLDLHSHGDTLFRTRVVGLKNYGPYSGWFNSPSLVYQGNDEGTCEGPNLPFWFPPPPIVTDGNYHQVQWVHAKRGWELEKQTDTDPELDNKKNPRFVFGFRTVERMGHALFDETTDVEEWPKPTTTTVEDGETIVVEKELPFRFTKRDKRYYPGARRNDAGELLDNGILDFAMRMTDKRRRSQDNTMFISADFEQVGEVLNVWLFGHEVNITAGGEYNNTRTTFAEFMANGELSGILGNFPSAGYLSAGDEIIVQEEDDDNGDNGDNGEPPDPPDEFQLPETARDRWLVSGEPHRVNRLRLTPWTTRFGNPATGAVREFHVGAVVGLVNEDDEAFMAPPPEAPARYLMDSRHGVPALPAGVRLMDALVCDGPGREPPDQYPDRERLRFYNANGFTGKMTPGLVNLNTATREVLRTLPHMTRIVHETLNNLDLNPWSRVPEAMIRYRERLGDPDPDPTNVPGYFADNSLAFSRTFNTFAGPAYAHRGRDRDWFRPQGGGPPFDEVPALFRGMRGERGMASIGETLLLTQSGNIGRTSFDTSTKEWEYATQGTPQEAFNAIDFNSSWRIDYATMPDRHRYRVNLDQTSEEPVHLFYDDFTGEPRSARISTDVLDVYDPSATQTQGYPAGFHPDEVAEDAQEANLLFSGMSNMITTRSDVFTVYFRVRSFRQNPVTGKWDATDPDHIIEDARYVMLVDRSEVNKPTDRPKILYLEKLPK